MYSLGHIGESSKPCPSSHHTSTFPSEKLDDSLHERLGFCSGATLLGPEIVTSPFGQPERLLVLFREMLRE